MPTETLRWIEDSGGWSLYEVTSGDRVGALVAGPPGLSVGRALDELMEETALRRPMPPELAVAMRSRVSVSWDESRKSRARRCAQLRRPPEFHQLKATERNAADARAEALLNSLLTPVQRAERAASGLFWVDTPRGRVRLGAKYDIRHCPLESPARVRCLCVIPAGWSEHRQVTPEGDFWTNLVLMLAADPDRFFEVAVVRSDDLAAHACCPRCGNLMAQERAGWSCYRHGVQPELGRRWVT